MQPQMAVKSLDPIYIRKSKKPRAFDSQTQQQGFYYRHNKKAWIMSQLFHECVTSRRKLNFPVKKIFAQKLYLQKHTEKCHIITIESYPGQVFQAKSYLLCTTFRGRNYQMLDILYGASAEDVNSDLFIADSHQESKLTFL